MTEPPRLPDSLLRHVLPRGEAGDTIRGDLIEEWHRRASTKNAKAATRWYWRQAVSVSTRYAWRCQRRVRVVSDPGVRTGRRYMLAIDNLRQDIRYAVRSYLKAPSFTIAILATLALGIGASTAIFSLVNGILLQPLPLPEPDRLVYANEINAKGQQISISVPNYRDWKARVQSFTTIALSREEPLTLTGVDRAERLRARRVTGNFFTVLGVSASRGRMLDDSDDRPEAVPALVASDGFWKSHLGADPSALGRTLSLDGVAYTIVGVMPAAFEYLRPYDLFVSIGPVVATPNLTDRGNHNGFNAVGRLKPGVAAEAASTELKTIAAALEREYPNTNTGISIRAERLADRFVDSVRLTLLALFGAVAFLLLIACVNVANLLIVRGASRQHELAVRAALGGGRARLATQLLVESTLVSVAGGALGVGVAGWLVRGLVAMAPEGTPRIEAVHLDGTALLFALLASATCGIVFGSLPALQVSAVRGQHALVRGRAAMFAARSHRLRRGLMVVETALALILLTGAGLMARTLQRLTNVDTGIRPDHLLTTRFVLAGPQWTDLKRIAFYDQFLSRVRALPGVTQAALTFSLPIDGSNWNSIFYVADKPIPERAQLPSAAMTPVTAGYFETMGMRMVAGRVFDGTETSASAKVIVVNELLARKLWPGENAVGKRLKQGWPETPEKIAPWREVVGVVSDVKFNGVTADTPMQVYIPAAQDGPRSLALVARVAVDPLPLAPAVERALHELDKDIPLFQTRTMDALIDSTIARERMSMLIFTVFAIVALTLAAVGLYGVVSHGVTERTHEIGVRMALGADGRHVLALVVRQGLAMAAIGTGIGVAGAIALSRSIEGLLFGVAPTDPVTLASVVAMLLAVATIACCVPAWRATRVDPTTALRSE